MSHPFEQAGLGKAPYILVGVKENMFNCGGGVLKPGGTCDYCSSGIRYECVIQSADGIVSKVGTDCVLKLDRKDNRGLVTDVTDAKRKIDAQNRAKRAEKKRIEKAQIHRKAQVMLKTALVQKRLMILPHPFINGLTMLDYCQWLFANAGDTGKDKASRVILDETFVTVS